MLKKLLLPLLCTNLYSMEQIPPQNAINAELLGLEKEIERLQAERALNLFKARLALSHCLLENSSNPEMHSAGFPVACHEQAFVFAMRASTPEFNDMVANFKKAYLDL